MFIVINDKLIVSITENKEVAELLAGATGSIMEFSFPLTDSTAKILSAFFQGIVNEALRMLDANRQIIERENLSVNKKEMN